MSTGPRATDVLANERTFLAYLRTALSFIAFGFVVARFALFTQEIAFVLHTTDTGQHWSTGFGTGIALFGALVAVYGGYRYAATERALASDRAVGMPAVTAVLGALVVSLIGIVVGIGLIVFR